MRAGNALARVRKCAGSPGAWLPDAYVMNSSLKYFTPNQLKRTILIKYYVCVDKHR